MNSRLVVFLVVLVACSVGASPAALAQAPEEPQAPDDTCLSPGTPQFEEAGCDPGGDSEPDALPPGCSSDADGSNVSCPPGGIQADLDEGPAGDGVLEEDDSSRQAGGAAGSQPQATGSSEAVSGAGVEPQESQSNRPDVQSVQLARTGLEAWPFALLGGTSLLGGLVLLGYRRSFRS